MTYRFGPYQLDTSIPLLLRDSETVAIPARPLAALVLLVERRHTAVSKRDLMDALWPQAFVEEGSLTQLVSTLRKVLAPGFDESPIQTLPKIGYRFVAEVREAVPTDTAYASNHPPNQPPAGAADPVASLHVPDRWSSWKRVSLLCGSVIVLAVVSALLLHPSRTAHGREQAGRDALAVLPFENLSGSPDSAWVATAVQEMLSTDLRLSHGLQVLSTEEVNRALQEVSWDRSADPGPDTLRRLSSDLDCGRVVLGAYLLESGQLRLDLRVVDLHTGRTELESAFARPEDNLLPLLAEVSARTSSALGMGPDRVQQARAITTGLNPAAYKLYAEAVARNRIFDFSTASDLLQQAIAIDPNFTAAHVELSTAWSASGQEKKAIAEAERAYQLSGHLPRELQLLAQARLQGAKHQFGEAAATYRALFSFFPENREYGRLLIQSLSNAGHSDDALVEAQKMLVVSNNKPSDLLLFSVVADMYSNLGDWPKSLEWATRGAEESRRRGATILYERLLTTESQANLYMGRYAPAQGETDEALELARQYRDVSGELRALNRQGQIASAQGLWPAATSALLAAVALERAYEQPQREAHTLLTLSHMKQSQGDLREAFAYGLQARDLAKQLGLADVITEAKLQLAILESAKGNRSNALAQLSSVRGEAATIHDGYLEQQARKALASMRAAN